MTWENIAKNWKSSGAGVISAIAGLFAILYPDKQAIISQVAATVSALALAVFALSAKDNDVTGTALNPRAEIAGEPTPLPSPKAAATIEAKKP